MKTKNQLINDMKDLFYFLDENFSKYEIVDMYNTYAVSIRCEIINNIEYINEDLSGLDPVDIINMAVYGKYDSNDSYYTYDGFGNIQTINEYRIVEHIKSEVDDEEFYTFLIENDYFSKEEYKDYLNNN